ncbi:hypothetical protein [Kribbella kalugense]|uniref:Uncharacterized protein n=1 Tax=Kribbella kalugense TaxID=2512221 RepID=A0A4R7ZJB7_9ACTN|nr:hypothetical protein [Kribbella kalugense]TDW17395.1 hypothetical protein EV650_3962 [Kribbella kalugense]
MEDVEVVSAELHRLADSEPLDPFDTNRVVERGRRGRRRRKLFGVGGAVAGVAAIAITASLLPNLSSAKPEPGVAEHKPQNPLFLPVPGVPFGEAGADQRITKAEATRRCSLRYPEEKRPLQGGDPGVRSGHLMMYDVKNGQKFAQCIVPGGDKPTAALAAAAAKDPLPVSSADKLRNCSVIAWIDLTDWQVVASDQSKTLGRAELVAISPSGHKVVDCGLSADEEFPGVAESSTSFATLTNLNGSDPVLDPSDRSVRTDMYVAGGGGGGCTNGICTTYGMTGWGRVKSKAATTIRIRIGSSPVYKVPVGQGGWFAFTWSTKAKYNIKDQPKVGAYDKAGKLVKKF